MPANLTPRDKEPKKQGCVICGKQAAFRFQIVISRFKMKEYRTTSINRLVCVEHAVDIYNNIEVILLKMLADKTDAAEQAAAEENDAP